MKIGGGDLGKGNKRLGGSNGGRTFCRGRTEESESMETKGAAIICFPLLPEQAVKPQGSVSELFFCKIHS